MRLQKTFYACAITVWILTELTGCATITPSTTPKPSLSWNQRKIQLSQLHNWQINGKIAVTTAQDSGSASIDWSQHAQHYSISLYGPFGSNGITLNGNPGSVTMQTSNGQKATAATAEQLLAQQWGWKLPVSHLKYWVRGLPAPNLPEKSRFDSANRLQTLNQQGFTIQYTDYMSMGNLELPRRLTITSAGLKSKLVIYKWNISN